MISIPHPLNTTACLGFIEEGLWQTAGDVPLLIRGWLLLTDGAPWHEVQAWNGTRLIFRSVPTPRPDVSVAYPDHEHAERSGFLLRLPVLDPTEVIAIKVVSTAPEAVTALTVHAYEIPGRSALIPSHAVWRVNRNADHPPVGAIADGVTFSVVIPVYNPELAELSACLDSLIAQTFTAWEAQVVDDASTDSAVVPLLEKYAAGDNRIRVIHSPQNKGIGRATNRGITAARNKWTCFLDHDDQLLPQALERLAHTITDHDGVELIYSDEEKITADGTPHSPLLKPGWSPTFLRGVMYVGHFLSVRSDRLREVGGIDPTFDGIQDFELVLRLSELNLVAHHLPEVLYQWRMGQRSSARLGNVKGDMDQRQRDAVAAHLKRMGHPGEVVAAGSHRIIIEPPPAFEPPPVTWLELTADSALTAWADQSIETNFVAVSVPGALSIHVDEESMKRLLFHAQAQPDCIFAPTLISRDGAVAESGCTVNRHGDVVRLMHGFHPAADGWNGSLVCHREVRTTSGIYWVMSRQKWRELISDAPTHDRSSTEVGLAWLIRRTTAVTVIVNARATIDSPLIEIPRIAANLTGVTATDPFWNPQFDSTYGDYRLVANAADSDQWQFDFPLDSETHDPRIRIIGWCLPPDGAELTAARLWVGSWTIPAVVRIPRPDVTALWPHAKDRLPGFELRFELPAGLHAVAFDVQTDTSNHTWQTLLNREIRVDLSTPNSLESDPGKLVAFQLGLHPKHPARPVAFESLPVTSAVEAWPRLSIVTPSYQQGEFLTATIQSIEANNLSGIEHVVQDGGSTDATLEILRQNPATHRRWFSEPDHGQADAIRRGFKQTTGAPTDLMAWINSDDIYSAGALDYVRDYFARHPEVDVLYGNRIVVDSAGHEINRWYLPGHDPAAIELNDYVPQETLFWRRRIWDQVGGIDPRFQFALDWDLILRFQAARANIVHVSNFLASFRVHDAQKTSAQMNTFGQTEIDQLRQRTLGRIPSAEEITYSPVLQRYLLASAAAETSDRPSTRAD